MKSESLTQENILQKTFELLLTQGYDNVSITEIQKATGISRGLLYHYYQNKEALFLEVIERFFVDLFKIDLTVVCHFTVEEMIAYMEKKHKSLSTIGVMKSSNQFSIIDYDFLFYQVLRKNDHFASRYREIRDEELEAWTLVLQNSQEQGLLKERIDILLVAPMFVYITDGVWFKEGVRHKVLDVIKIATQKLTDYYQLIRK